MVSSTTLMILLSKLLEAQFFPFLSLSSEWDLLILIKWKPLMVTAPHFTPKSWAVTEIETSFNLCHSVRSREILFFSRSKSWKRFQDSWQISSRVKISFQTLKHSQIGRAFWLEIRWETKWHPWWESKIVLVIWRKPRWFRRWCRWDSMPYKSLPF